MFGCKVGGAAFGSITSGRVSHTGHFMVWDDTKANKIGRPSYTRQAKEARAGQDPSLESTRFRDEVYEKSRLSRAIKGPFANIEQK